ncbi:MAG: efflux RND transporter permease subunit [Candidatus Krumholzibacteriia bacterium]
MPGIRNLAVRESGRTAKATTPASIVVRLEGKDPLALEWALGAERFSPLAVAVMGGLAAGTMLTMVVIPVLYDVLDSAQESFRKQVS